ncbi:centrosome-associated zinc finger protein Cp190 [Eurosta solidaginis]|uniref:centrosome-associated zinc finger protein Cp190 n=1 Tax=Eurosta solidaginis TaxID=178769 RepID=UPI0035312A07
MGEIKSVKVDNWGVFFLQKLQNFFNKTDYCDLTLQFRDNSQLKVHRLVLSACTDYFNVLEQNCEMVDDALIMPNELQADVVVPIVNFMYTGTLEFELKMYGKLLRTAKDMNMTVLLKLLEAHRRTMEGVNRMQRPPSPKPLRRRVPGTGPLPTVQQHSGHQPRFLASPNSVTPGIQRRVLPTKANSQQNQINQQIGPTSLIRAGHTAAAADSVQNRAPYTQQNLHETTIKQEPGEEPTPTSPFEQLRKGYNNNKRPASTSSLSPPTKKLNIEDVKEFAEQQRMRKQIAAEYGEDQGAEYESSMLEDDIHNDDDDDDMATTSATANARQTQMQHGSTTITINQNEKPPTIVVKDSSNSKVNHAKIIKEVLRQYPHLVKSNKNIKLKIMPSSGDQPQKIIVKKEQLENITDESPNESSTQTQSVLRVQTSSQTLLKPIEKSHTTAQQSSSQQAVVPKLSPSLIPPPAPAVQQKLPTIPASSANVTVVSATTSAAAPPAQKRRIDSKTMHALIALGAENTTGPWLCLRCGVNGRPISIPSYRGFRRHLINTHKEQIDPALCEHCGWRSSNKRELHFHAEVEHKVKSTSYTFPLCLLCSKQFLDTNTLNQHMLCEHPDESKQQCIYCNKIFAREIQLYNHMKTYHKKQAIDDGIIDYSDEEFPESQYIDEPISQQVEDTNKITIEKKESKIKIISDISLPSAGSIIKLESNSICSDANAQIGITDSQEQEFIAITNKSTDISSDAPKFVTVDGSEMVLTDEQRQEIMAQLNQEHGASGVVMVLNEPGEYTTGTHSALTASDDNVGNSEKKSPHVERESAHEAEPEDESLEDEIGNVAPERSTAEEEIGDNQIYNEVHATAQDAHTDAIGDEKKNTSGLSVALDESKESMENLEWAENLISAHEMADQELEEIEKVKENKTSDAINQKLKELTGDWTEDENEEEHEDEELAMNTPNTEKTTSAASPGNTDTNISKVKDHVDNSRKEDTEIEKTAEEIVKQTIEQENRTEAETETLDAADDNDTAEDNDCAGSQNTDDHKSDVDNFDTLMKDLHKDDTDSVKVKSAEEEEISADEEKNEESVLEKDEHTIKEDMLTNPLKEIPTEEAEKTENVDDAKRDDETIASADNIMTLERDVLLDELIGGDTGCVQNDEFITKATTPGENSASKATVDEPTPEVCIDTVNVENAEAMDVDEVQAEDDIEMKEQLATVTDVDDKLANNKNVVDDVHEAKKGATTNSEKTRTSETDEAKTSERVKSLISEWADDEEEDEDQEKDTKAAAADTGTTTTTVDEEQL